MGCGPGRGETGISEADAVELLLSQPEIVAWLGLTEQEILALLGPREDEERATQ
jgi:hypothetical protein